MLVLTARQKKMVHDLLQGVTAAETQKELDMSKAAYHQELYRTRRRNGFDNTYQLVAAYAVQAEGGV